MPGRIRELVKGLTRSSGWSKVRDQYLKAHPECAACKRKATQVHHIKPFHIYPYLELKPENFIGFCAEHHLLFGHLMYWRSWNPDVVEDARKIKEKILNRPDVGGQWALDLGIRKLRWFNIKYLVYNLWR